MASSDGWLDARFRSAIAKQDKDKTGLVRTEEYVHVCHSCGQQFHNRNPDPPAMCTGTRFLTGAPCISTDFQTSNVIHVEAMPIDRVIIDFRKRGERGW